MRASLFVTCLVDAFFPEVAESVVRVLERNGVSVDVPPEQTCCGQPAYNSGYRKEAKAAAKAVLRAFADSEAVVVPSGSCAAMIRREYLRLMADEPDWREKAEALAAKTYEFSEYLVHVVGADAGAASFPARAAVHLSCHMTRGLGVRDEPRRLLERVEGLELVPFSGADDCCGFGGTFAVKMPALSAAMADEKIGRLEEAGADVLIGGDMGCLWHLAGRLRRLNKPVRVLHLAQVLDGAGSGSEGAPGAGEGREGLAADQGQGTGSSEDEGRVMSPRDGAPRATSPAEGAQAEMSPADAADGARRTSPPAKRVGRAADEPEGDADANER
ncbi:MAG: (Fe-S)-binding protein [Hydrogenibacillus schlegelii]|uniref:(Fe-S)-binding protein n=1 Tax=Hydrogenibacillus schlegelii TaxID=1484 RepID=A0A947CY81_HYDSH|nr:(Fe-S)-binding protein [Hydrogenibacillus schlegelii]